MGRSRGGHKAFVSSSSKVRLDAKIFGLALSFVFDKNYLIMDYLGLKDSSRQLQINCAISYFFYLHLMLHACAARFDVTKNLEIF